MLIQNLCLIFELLIKTKTLLKKMKKALTLFAGVALVAMLFTSCKKDYTCTCTVSGVSTTVTYSKVSKKDATTSCDASNATFVIAGGSCKLN